MNSNTNSSGSSPGPTTGSTVGPSVGLSLGPSFEPIVVRREGSTLIATITRPEAMNALNAQVLLALDQLVAWVEIQTDIRAMVLTGAGAKAFVAGADIREFGELGAPEGAALARRGQKLFTRLESLAIPVIAAVNGFALGGGLELALACDFIIASDNAKFGLPECTLGLMPGYGGTVRLPRRVGTARALEMTLTGGMLSANEAFQIGLVNRTVPQEELMTTVLEIAKTIGSRAPIAIGQIKKSIHEGADLPAAEALEKEARSFGELFITEDKAEGVKAFIEKRKAEFKGK